MKEAMILAIETYAELTGYTVEHVNNEIKKENKVIVETIMMLMFAAR